MPNKVAIEVTGALDNPGIYYFQPGTSLREVLKELHLQKRADRRKLPMKKIFFQSQRLEIPSKSER